MPHKPLIFIIAGEASGDQLGADLMASLRAVQEVQFAGIGGEAMKIQGLQSLFPMEELSLMGLFGILRNLFKLKKRLAYTLETIQALKPDVVITIDAPEFSFRVMKHLHNLSLRPRLIHYVAPTVWAWRAGRAKKIAGFLDHLLCLYPFEPPYFEKYGLKTTFVGHPIAKDSRLPRSLRSLAMTSSRAPGGSVAIQDLDLRDPNFLCVLPGSRRSEIEMLLPIFKETVIRIKKDVPDLKIVIPTLPSVQSSINQNTKGWPVDVEIVVGDEARNKAFQKASAALAASGTVALQLSAAGLPFIIAYKVGKITGWIASFLLKTPWACMVNILLAFKKFGPNFVLSRQAIDLVPSPWIPEFIQGNCKAEKIAPILTKLLKDQKVREQQVKAMEEAILLLKAPSKAVGEVVLEEI